MRLGWLHCETIDWQQILWAGGKCDNAVHLGAQRHITAGCADRGAHFDPVAVNDRDVHKKVQRCRRLRRLEPERGQSGSEVVGAVVVILRAAEELIAPAVASGEE